MADAGIVRNRAKISAAIRNARAAQQQPEGLSYASVGSGSIGHLFMVLLQKRTGVKLTHVPYRGGGPAMNDALERR